MFVWSFLCVLEQCHFETKKENYKRMHKVGSRECATFFNSVQTVCMNNERWDHYLFSNLHCSKFQSRGPTDL